jgi:hypothetical protein
MTSYQVNSAGVEKAKQMIASHHYDLHTPWSEAAPSADAENNHIERHGYDGYGQWHLAIDMDASQDTKDRYGFPFGDFQRVNRAALIHAKQRASQNDHAEVAEVADDLLKRLDDTANKG